MRVSPVDSALARSASLEAPAASGTMQRFSTALREAVETLSRLDLEAERQVEALSTGSAENIHDVVIAVGKANIALSLAVQVTKKAIEAYQEVMRMQI